MAKVQTQPFNRKAMLLNAHTKLITDVRVIEAGLQQPPWTPFVVDGQWYFTTFENNTYKCSVLVNC